MAEKVENAAEKYTADTVLCAALDVAELILKNGGEIHRVEDTIERICKSFNAAHVDVFAITNMITASLRMPDGDYSIQNRRVFKSETNLYMVEMMNEISREICSGELKIENLKERVDGVKKRREYPFCFYYMAAMLASGGFTLFFGGDFTDSLCAAAVGLVIMFLSRKLPKFINPLIATVIKSAVAGALAMISVKCGPGHHTDMIMIGTIMLLIPGLAIGNAIRDLMSGDTLSGSMRLIESVLVAVMIAFGYAAAMFIFGGVS